MRIRVSAWLVEWSQAGVARLAERNQPGAGEPHALCRVMAFCARTLSPSLLIAITHNLMECYEAELERQHGGVSNAAEDRRRAKRAETLG